MLMAYDSRFPHMQPLFDGRAVANVEWDIARRARKFAEGVQRRTGLWPFYNVLTGAIFFSLTTAPENGPPAIPRTMWNKPGDIGHVVDNCVSFLNLGKMPRARKDAITESNAQKEKWRKEDERRAFFDERRPDALDYADYLDKRRRGVQNTSVVV